MASVMPVVEPEVSAVPIDSAPPIPDSFKIVALKDPNTLDVADDCPVIVWGDYTYWPLSYMDDRAVICLVAYDLLNNVVNQWELPGAQFVVSVTVNNSRQEITLMGFSGATVTVSWNEIGNVVPSNRQYFWIINRASHAACRAATSYILFAIRAVNDDQLWLVDNGRQAIFPKTGNPGISLDHDEATDRTLVLLAQTSWGRTQQRWIINATGNLKPAASTLLATKSILNSVVLQVASATASDNQLWYLKPYVPSPDLSTDQFSLLLPGESFTLSNQDQMLSSSGSGNPLTLVPDANSSALLWLCNGDGVLVNAQDGLAITVSGTSSVIASPLTGCPEQQWSLTPNGFLVCRANGLLMVGRGQTVVLSSYDALGPADQIWFLQFQKAKASSGVVGKGTLKSAASSDNVTQLTITAQVSNDFWAGTSDQISIMLGFKMLSSQLLFDSPSRGEVVTVTIDLNSMFGKSRINLFEDVDFVSLWQTGFHPIASDAWKLASLVLKAKDEATNREFTNYTFQKVNTDWLDNHKSVPAQVWANPIPWGAWLDADKKPVDLNGSTYPVGFIPYIGDLKSWRTYDPSTIDGVGQILGMRQGRLIGDLLMLPRKTEVLQPTDETHSYTWVFKPDGTIIYKLWDKQEDRNEYIRHSQLGSGEPVICAGEMHLKKDRDSYVVSDVIAMVNDASGHYKPDGGACLRYVEQKLQELGIPTDHIVWYSK